MRTQLHKHTLCDVYEVSPELLDRGLTDVAVGSMLEASYVFGPQFDFITEPHTDLLLLHTPKAVVFVLTVSTTITVRAF